MTYPIKSPRKLIEVALPLDDINIASAREKSIRHGHPSTLHLWWARRPLATARAVLFAQLVNDPGYERNLQRGVNKRDAAAERERLFEIIKKLVLWENTSNETVLAEARAEIWKSWRETCQLNRGHPQAAELFNPDKLPAFYDPFAGGGSIPLEAQRLGLESYASDLNPVAVLINKAMIEIPPKFAGRAPVGPLLEGDEQKKLFDGWSGAQGLAEDVRRYGAWMRDEAQKKIGHLYPPVEITKEMALGRPDLKPLVGQKLTVLAWLWARTVKSPNPAFSHVDVPLASTFMLATKPGKEAYLEPVVKGDKYQFKVKMGKPDDIKRIEAGTKPAGRGSTFECLVSKSPIDGKYIKSEGQAGRMGTRLIAVVAEGIRSRVYLSPTSEMETIAQQAHPTWRPEQELVGKSIDQLPLYGMKHYWQLFTARQLVTLTTLSDLVQKARERVKQDALTAGMEDNGQELDAGGTGATAYADAVAVYLGLAASKAADNNSTVCSWMPGIKYEVVRSTFSRQALLMTWDYAESNPFAQSSGDFYEQIKRMVKVFDITFTNTLACQGFAGQIDAQNSSVSKNKIVSTDPPYYDNICYADLSDFFYVWLRRPLQPMFPALFSTLATPKTEELVATPYRHGSKSGAEKFFLDGMTQAMHRLAEQAHPAFPVTIYYAFKQAESGSEGTTSTGWETFLEAVNQAGFTLTGTWPMRTEREARSIGYDANALASSIILVCRKRPDDAPTISRREFIRELNAALPEALDEMTRGGVNSPVVPVDLSQAIIGPGMAIFSKYAAVLEADGTPMSVRTALQLINRFLAEDDFDTDTQFCLHWFEGNGWGTGKFGEADVLARAKGTSVAGITESGVVASGQGSVRLLRYAEYPVDWSPATDQRIPVWEAVHHLIRTLQLGGGETAAGELVAQMPALMEGIRQLAYRLYTLCERRGWAEDARAYNELITAWSGIEAASHVAGHVNSQIELDI